MDVARFALKLGGGHRLVLAGVEHGWIWLAAGMTVLVLLLILYRYERHLVTRRTGLLLLALRVAAAMALVAALFEPVAERVSSERVRGRVVLGLDLSESMATADPGRLPADRDGLRKTLGLSATDDASGITRREIVRRLVDSDWLRRLRGEHDLDTLGFARDVVSSSPASLSAAMAKPTKPDDPAAMVTDWTGVLEQALVDRGGQPILGVVLLTDGRANGNRPADRTVDRLKERQIPVFPVLVGSMVPPLDVAIAAVKSPEAVDKGQTARIDVTVKLDGLPAGTEVPVTLERAGISPMRQTVRSQPDGGRPVVTFRAPFDAVGEYELAVAVGPMERDVRPDNDRRPIKVVVTDDQAKVLLVDGEARWEFQYLRNALMRDPRVKLDSVIFHQPTSGGAADTFYPTKLPVVPPPPAADSKAAAEPDPLGAYDLIVLGDVSAEDLPFESWSRLERYVAERGGTLVMAAGGRSWPALAEQESVRKLLPMQSLRVAPVDPKATDPDRPTLPAGVRIRPTRVGETGPWPMFQFADDADQSRAVWASLPRMPWVLTGSPKPAATSLAAIAEVSDSETDPEASVFAAMPYGLGKVFWVGTDSTWRWRFRVGDAYHHRFWGQIVQWAARGKLAAGNRLVQFGPVPPRVPDGTPAIIRARFAETLTGVDASLLVAARVFKTTAKTGSPPPANSPEHPDSGEPIAVIPLRARPDQPRVFEATAPVLPAGRYLVRLDAPQVAEAMQAEGPAPEATLEVEPVETSERIELAAARDPLDRLATTTGGRVFTDSDCSRLPDLIQSRTVSRLRIDPTRLWDRPEALLVFFALLTVEWVARKRAGLP